VIAIEDKFEVLLHLISYIILLTHPGNPYDPLLSRILYRQVRRAHRLFLLGGLPHRAHLRAPHFQHRHRDGGLWCRFDSGRCRAGGGGRVVDGEEEREEEGEDEDLGGGRHGGSSEGVLGLESV